VGLTVHRGFESLPLRSTRSGFQTSSRMQSTATLEPQRLREIVGEEPACRR
jgi:hypothetical protein